MFEIISQLFLHCAPVISGLISDIPSVSGLIRTLPEPQLVRIDGVIVSRSGFTPDLTALTCFSHHWHVCEKNSVLLIKFTPHAFPGRWVWDCGSVFWSGFLFSRVPKVLVYVPWVCSRVLRWDCTRKMALSGSSVSDRRRMSNRLGGRLSLTLSRIATWTRLVAMDNS